MNFMVLSALERSNRSLRLKRSDYSGLPRSITYGKFTVSKIWDNMS